MSNNSQANWCTSGPFLAGGLQTQGTPGLPNDCTPGVAVVDTGDTGDTGPSYDFAYVAEGRADGLVIPGAAFNMTYNWFVYTDDLNDSDTDVLLSPTTDVTCAYQWNWLPLGAPPNVAASCPTCSFAFNTIRNGGTDLRFFQQFIPSDCNTVMNAELNLSQGPSLPQLTIAYDPGVGLLYETAPNVFDIYALDAEFIGPTTFSMRKVLIEQFY